MRAAYGRVLQVLKTKMTSTAEAATTATESSISVANRCSGVSSTPPQTVTCSLEQQFTEKMSVQHTSDAQRQRRPRELVSVAPMMEYTDHHFRQFMRLLTKKTKLYTEMVVDHIIIHSPDVEPILQFDPIQKPIALQIGGSNPDTLAEACQKVIPYGYEEVNLNCGCPSDRVATKSCFGARLMKDPQRVKECTAAMKKVLDPHGIEVTVKCRIGADDVDSYDDLKNFVETVSQSGVTHFIVHARKCWLNGLSPKQNRTIPPLKYHWIAQLSLEFPHLRISLNGGIQSMSHSQKLLQLASHSGEDHVPAKVEELKQILTGMENDSSYDDRLDLTFLPHSKGNDLSSVPGLFDSMMIGREAFGHPWMFSTVDSKFFGVPDPNLTRREVIERYIRYAENLAENKSQSGYSMYGSAKPNALCKPLLRFFAGHIGSGAFRKRINESINELKMSDIRSVVLGALEEISQEVLDCRPSLTVDN